MDTERVPPHPAHNMAGKEVLDPKVIEGAVHDPPAMADGSLPRRCCRKYPLENQ
jgi:hypothetical protein